METKIMASTVQVQVAASNKGDLSALDTSVPGPKESIVVDCRFGGDPRALKALERSG
jgi:hypothetical protein